MFLVFSLVIELLIIFSISLANIVTKINYHFYYIFYNGIYGIVISTIIPLIYAYKYNQKIDTLGIKKIRLRQIMLIILFVLFSIGGQLLTLDINTLDFNLLKIGIIPLIMTTFFEEFLFRGFFQVRFEKYYGTIISIILSGLFFAVYHFGYPGFRNLNSILLESSWFNTPQLAAENWGCGGFVPPHTQRFQGEIFNTPELCSGDSLFAVGIGFAIAFKISGNNIGVSFFVNLPNAVLTYLLKSKQFPEFYKNTSIIAGITIVFIVIIMIYGIKMIQTGKNELHK